MRSMVWFRSDLRVADNDALYHARRNADDGVVAVFTICPEQWKEHDWGTMKADFIRRCLIELQKSLSELNIPLKIVIEPRFEGVPAALLKLAQRHGVGELHMGREYEVNERKRDQRVVDAFEDAGIAVHRHTNKVLFEPGHIRTKEDKWYSVFTPFKKRLYARWDEETPEVLPVPKPCASRIDSGDSIPENDQWKAWGFDFDGEQATRPDLWPGGEAHAMERFTRYLESGMDDYKDRRDSPADTGGTSAISPYLTMGCIGPRQIVHACLDANKHEFWKGSKGITHYISEIVWREFYQHLLVGFPRVSKGRNFNTEYDGMPWADNDQGHFEAWCEGRTGVPIVDAAMRQLNTTGWMHNRCRMIVAMFLTKNLLLDWRLGERYFMQKLVDGDQGSNNGGWQWSSSTGTDAAPYFRVYNPISQSERHDPEGTYIRTYVPELAELDSKQIHDPSERAGGLFGGLDYPEPIVDLRATRERAIEAFKQFREDGEVRVL